jgi:hypothetical protein
VHALLDFKSDAMAAVVHKSEQFLANLIGPFEMPKTISSFELTLRSRSRDLTLPNWWYGNCALPFLTAGNMSNLEVRPSSISCMKI